MTRPDGRSIKSNRGIGSGSNSAETSSKRPGSTGGGYANKVSDRNQGSGYRSYDLSTESRQSKNMGSSGPRYAGPKMGRDKGSKTY